MTPFQYMQALGQMLGRGGKDFAAVQQNMFAEMAKRMTEAAVSALAPDA